MRPLGVVVLDVLSCEIIEVLLAKDQEVIEALLLDRLHEPLNVGVEVWRAIGEHLDARASVRQGLIELAAIIPIPIAGHEVNLQASLLGILDKCLGLLFDPGSRGMASAR